jgi:hypothetical protein
MGAIDEKGRICFNLRPELAVEQFKLKRIVKEDLPAQNWSSTLRQTSVQRALDVKPAPPFGRC